MGGVSQAYDGNGNLSGDGTFAYAHDAENRLTAITQGGSPVGGYTWDAQGRRKTRTVGGGGTVYVTDADNREVLEYDGSTGQILRWHAYGTGVDEVLATMETGAGTRAGYIPDIQGSVLATVASASGAVSKGPYLPYGESGVTTGGYRYTGRRLDPETAGSAAQPAGLYYYRARMYSPATGRFLETDPVGLSVGANLYVYVKNDPLNAVDPYGLWTISIGASGYINVGWFSGQLTVGIIADGFGNAGIFGSVNAGPAAGGGFKVAASGAYSTAPRIHNLEGWGNNVSVVAGAGPAVSYDWSKGQVSPEQSYQSHGVSLGFGAGGGVSAGPSYTTVFPIVEFDTGAPSAPSLSSQSIGSTSGSFGAAGVGSGYGSLPGSK